MKYHKTTLMGAVVVVGFTVAAPFVIQAQEYLPPVIDRSSVTAPQAGTPAVNTRSGGIEARLARLERMVDNKALVDMLMRLDSLQSELQVLQGEQESIVHGIEGVKQRQRDLYLDIDRRLQQLESSMIQLQSSPSATPAAGNVGIGIPSVGVSTIAVSAAIPDISGNSVSADEPIDPEAERLAYEKAFNLLKEGQYDQAIIEFQVFLELFAQGDYADNAQYWLGEANYVTRRFEAAEQEFLKVLNLHPESSKVADAQLKLGYTYYELSKWTLARQTLNDVVAAKPNSTVARLAENRLQKMRLEGR